MLGPNYEEARCPISPDGASYQYSLQHDHGVTSPGNNSDNNYYQSPGLSPGDWNVASPGSMTSPHSSNASWRSFDSSVQGSPLSAPAAMATSSWSSSTTKPPILPSDLGSYTSSTTSKNFGNMTDTERRVALEKVDEKFIAKSSFDRDRERNAIIKANSLMAVTQGRTCTVETKKLMITNKKPVGRGVIVPDGREHMATSTRKDKTTADHIGQQKKTNIDDGAEFEENVDDFKCELDRDREKWAQKQALRLVKGAGNFL